MYYVIRIPSFKDVSCRVNNSEISKKELNIQKTLVRDDVNIGRPGTRSLFIVLLYSSGSGTDKIFPVSSFIFLQKQRKTRLVEKKNCY
jgi:hypothetical protein